MSLELALAPTPAPTPALALASTLNVEKIVKNMSSDNVKTLALALALTLDIERIVKNMSSDNVKTLAVHPVNLDVVIEYESKKSRAMNESLVENKNTHAAIVDMIEQGIYTIEKRGEQIAVCLCNGIRICITGLEFALTLDIERIVKNMSSDNVKALAVYPADLDVVIEYGDKKSKAMNESLVEDKNTHAAIFGMIEQEIYTIEKGRGEQIEVCLWNGTRIYF